MIDNPRRLFGRLVSLIIVLWMVKLFAFPSWQLFWGLVKHKQLSKHHETFLKRVETDHSLQHDATVSFEAAVKHLQVPWWVHGFDEVKLYWCIQPCEDFFGKDFFNSWFAFALGLSLALLFISIAMGWWHSFAYRRQKQPAPPSLVAIENTPKTSSIMIEEVVDGEGHPAAAVSQQKVIEYIEQGQPTVRRRQSTLEYAKLVAAVSSSSLSTEKQQ